MTRQGRRNLKEQVVALRKEGKTIAHIMQVLKCSASTVAYHLYEKTRVSTKKRTNRESKNAHNLLYYHSRPLYNKYSGFFRAGHKYKSVDKYEFTMDNLKGIIPEKPVCYLTGDTLDMTKGSGFSLDHKVPRSRGGNNSLSNVGLCTILANKAKSNMTVEEFIDFCKRVLTNFGYTITDP